MKYRTYPGTDIRTSEVGFGMWTLAAGWWGNFTDDEAVAMLHRAYDLGITLYDSGDTYGNGRADELLGKAFAGRRDAVTITSKVGYDFYNHPDARRGQQEIPHSTDPRYLRQMLHNLLTNAVKHGTGPIRVTLEKTTAGATCRIEIPAAPAASGVQSSRRSRSEWRVRRSPKGRRS